MRTFFRPAFILGSALMTTVPIGAQGLWLRQTPTLNLIYDGAKPEYLTYHLARSYENSMGFHRKLFKYTPSEPVSIHMQDWGDFGHGGTSTMPWNFISLGIEPFVYTYDTMPANERMNWLMHHELVHVVATDKGADRDILFRKAFRGKVEPTKENPLSMVYSYLTVPRWYAPRWYHEGIATFLETWMAGGMGRALGGYDEMVFRTMVLEDAYFYDVIGLESEGTTVDFQTGQNSYLYGTRFVTYLAMLHGPEKVVTWFDRAPGSLPGFAAQFRKVFGTSLEEEWGRWVTWEHSWQKTNLELIRKYSVTKENRITPKPIGNMSRSFYDPSRGVLYAAVTRPEKPAQVLSIDLKTGAQKPLAEVVGPSFYLVSSLVFDPKGDKLFWTSKHQAWRDLNELDLATGRSRMLLKGCRIGDLTVSPEDQAIWGVRHNNGISTIVRIPKPYTSWESVLPLDYGKDLLDLDFSPDGRTLVGTSIGVSGVQKLVSLDVGKLRAGVAVFNPLHEFENNSASNFVFSADGRYLYGTTYYSGASNVFRYDLETRKMEALTNAETGYFRPLPISKNEMVAYRYTAKGFMPVRLPVEVREDVNAISYLGQQVAEKHPVVKTWNAGSPARVDLEKETTYLGPYKPFRLFGLTSAYPVVEGYKDAVAGGFRFNFADPMGLHTLDLTLAYSPRQNLDSSERFHGKLSYEHAPWTIKLARNATDFYDLFGPTKTSRKGHSASVAYHDYWIFDRPKLFDYTISAAYYGDLDTVPDYQNVRAPYREYGTLKAQLSYQDLRRTPGAVEEERGFKWSLTASGSRVNGENFPRLYGTFDAGHLLPLGHSSLWLRTAAGKSWGETSNPFSRFFFGGFGNNWVDYQNVSRYRQYYSFPGLNLNEASGNDFGKATLEWNLPPIRFRKLGFYGLFANWARFTLFTSYLGTDLGRAELRKTLSSAGLQLDISLVLFSDLESKLSFGYAVARHEGRDSHEFMASLKLLR